MTRVAAAGRRRACVLALAALLVLALAACKPREHANGDPRRTIAVALLESPPRIGPAVVEVRPQLDGAPVTGATVRVVGDMTHAGMVPVVAAAVDVGGGVYRTEGFVFDMAGDWALTVEVTYPDGSERATTLSTPVSR